MENVETLREALRKILVETESESSIDAIRACARIAEEALEAEILRDALRRILVEARSSRTPTQSIGMIADIATEAME